MLVEAARRRTFAIISHPDAGKTTLTEKFLLYAGAVQRAGAVKARDGPAGGDLGLDGAGASARHLDQLDRAAVPVPGPCRQPPRHARPQGLLRGHLPGARRRRRRGDGPRQRQGHRGADPQAVRGLPHPTATGADVPQQVRPPRPRAAGAARRDRGADRVAPDAGDVAGWPGRRSARCHRPTRRHLHPLRPHRTGRVAGARADRRCRRRGRHRGRPLADGHRRAGVARCRRRRRRRAVVPRRRLDAGLRRIGTHQLRRADDPRRRHRSGPWSGAAADRTTAWRGHSMPDSRRSCSRSRQTWIRRTAIAWRSPESAPDGSTAG